MVKECHYILAKLAYASYVFANGAIIAGTTISIHQAHKGKQTYWLPVMLILMILMRLPNQICVALTKGGFTIWFHVIGSLLSIASLSYLTHLIILNLKKEKEKEDNHNYTGTPTGTPLVRQ